MKIITTNQQIVDNYGIHNQSICIDLYDNLVTIKDNDSELSMPLISFGKFTEMINKAVSEASKEMLKEHLQRPKFPENRTTKR